MTGVSCITESGTLAGPVAITNTTGSHFSGDLFLAFSTASPGGFTPAVITFRPGAEARYDQLRFIPRGFLDPFYAAVVQGTEEAVLNALVANEDMTGRDGHRTPALPRDQVVRLLSGQPG
jgi:D-aminopeptidase